MDSQKIYKEELTLKKIELNLSNACKKIAPLWSLENFVAVNPYLGLSEYKFQDAMELLHGRGNIKATLPISFYLKAISEGKIKKAQIQEVLIKNQHDQAETPEEFLASLSNLKEDPKGSTFKTIIDLSEDITGKNWKRFMIDRISEWGASYFDKDQASWKTASSESIFKAWKEEASIDKTAEVTGIKEFRNLVQELPDDPIVAAKFVIEELNISSNLIEGYLHKLLLNVGGWAAYVARIDWDKGLAGEEGKELKEFLAILLSWEYIMFQSLSQYKIKEAWYTTKIELSKKENQNDKGFKKLLILQEAFDLANQQDIINKFESTPQSSKEEEIPDAQAIFCIDVRSEVYRRHLEATPLNIHTMGFAGFFAFPIKYVPLGHEEGLNQCPVLLNTSHTINESLPSVKEINKVIEKRKLNHHLHHAWKSFKLGAISCFSFVGPIGFSFLPKLFTDSFGITRPVPHPDHENIKKKTFSLRDVALESNNEISGIPLEERISMGETALKAMSLSDKFARMVLIVGHGSSSVNNPHATGLDCGACGGHTGEANSKVAAAVLNDLKVRAALKEKGIIIPETTYFAACQHDTTTDTVTVFNENKVPNSHIEDLEKLKESFKIAGKTARAERAQRMNMSKNTDTDKAIFERSKDWSQVRPEWGLAGCSAFVVAPRKRTKNIDFEGKSFLHSYDWQKDKDFGVLELIMTAPMVVTSWINLQYYASTVDNKTFGSGNKALHNVVGGLGVFEGNSGDLRTGLPWQSIHDGEKFQHEPLRLNVIIEAPIEAMDDIIEKHEGVSQLVKNEWIYLFAMNDQGKVAYKYTPDYKWVEVV